MSRHEASFNQSAAPALVDWFGRDCRETDDVIHTALDETETSLNWVVLGDEERRTRRNEHQVQVFYQRHCWMVVDKTHSHYSGVQQLQLEEKVTIDDQAYRVAWALERDGQGIVDFRLERIAVQENSRNDFRGR